MKKNLFIHAVLLFSLSVFGNSLSAQKSPDKIKNEITETLNIWNAACKNEDIEQVMSMLDNSDAIMVVGSADGEVNKGKDEIRTWLSQIFGFTGCSWDMDRIDIDSNAKTA